LAVARRGANPRPSQTRLGFGGAGGTGAPLICVFSLPRNAKEQENERTKERKSAKERERA
jgi:hypothetical protein